MNVEIGDPPSKFITLTNGAQVLAQREDFDGGLVVLAFRNEDYEPYITWCSSPAGECYSGHYFSSIADAAQDWEAR